MVTYTWGLYEQNVIKKLKQSTILSFSYKWLHGKTQVEACDTQTEFQLLQKLHILLDKANIVIAHNGDAFDIKKINSRFMIHKIPPPSPYVTIDTKKAFKSVAGFDSNSLNNLGIDLGEGEKVEHRGFPMWEGCMAGNKKDWADMKRYNKQDVELLERIYLRVRPWIKTHPSVVLQDKTSLRCQRCASDNLKKSGFRYTKTTKIQRYFCNNCFGYF